ncbi:FAS1-like dehydratase domain-containing protein [Roseivivax isoporae]|uniref:FAS1-like dehydratase domain-containing protein n=1 Tax=Roseivivax isoporae TaxID=591206 RepID=UPI0004B8C73B|nr:MaoC family dehydratase N-terminal domain-containing protein [Roseivivax isoporae]
MSELKVTDWIGREETAQARVAPVQAEMLAATLSDAGAEVPADGALLPPLWHWIAFLPTVPMADLKSDGHPRLGGFLPPVDLPRRMWASGALSFHRPLHVGERLTRHSVIRDVVEKHGSTGAMVFVTVAHEIAGEDGLAIRETQDIVYLEMPDRFRAPKPVPVPAAPILERRVPVSEALLFRFSACTFNAHRIHIDLPYAREVEKYPNLVVHGPLQAMMLALQATAHRGRAPDRFRFRGVHPMFHDADLRLLAEDGEDGALRLCTARGEDHQGLQATAEWEGGTWAAS